MLLKNFYKIVFFSLLNILAALVFSQSSYSDIVFKTNYVANTTNPFCITNPQLELTDTSIKVTFDKSLDSNYLDQKVSYIVNPSSFIIEDTLLEWERNNRRLFPDNFARFSPAGSFVNVDSAGNSFQYYYDGYTDVDTNLKFNFYNSTNYVKDSILFNLNLKNRLIKCEPFIYNSSIYLFTDLVSKDSAYIEEYDFSGNLLNSFGMGADSMGNFIYPIDFMKGPVQFNPLNSNELIFQTFVRCTIYLFDVTTFDFSRVIELTFSQLLQLNNTKRWGLVAANEYSYDSLGAAVTGSIVKQRDLNDTASIDHDKFFSLQFDWSGNLVKTNEFGQENIDSRALGITKKDTVEYIVGSTPFSDYRFLAQEYRSVLVVQNLGYKVDSILIYGNSNHVALQVEVVGDDIFVLSQNSNAWSNDSIFITLTKIPKQLLSSLRLIERNITSIQIYPNPTTEFIKSDSFVNGMEYRIYNLNGKLVSNGILKNQGVDVSSYNKGTYFIQLFNKNDIPSARATVFIKQ